MIPDETYQQMLSSLPILCVDLVIQDKSGEYLLVKRNNEPLRNQWWVPGGRVLRDESLRSAVIRKGWEELGLRVTSGPQLLGYHEYFLADRHAVSFVFGVKVRVGMVVLDNQSSDWGMFPNLPKEFDIQPFGVQALERV